MARVALRGLCACELATVVRGKILRGTMNTKTTALELPDMPAVLRCPYEFPSAHRPLVNNCREHPPRVRCTPPTGLQRSAL